MEASLLGTVRRGVSYVGGERNVFEARIVSFCEVSEIVGQIDLGREFAIAVEAPFDGVGFIGGPLLGGEIPMAMFLLHQAYFAPLHRFAEEIVSTDRDLGIFSGEVVLLVRIDLNGEVWQIVAADPDRGNVFRCIPIDVVVLFSESGGYLVIAQAKLLRDLPIGGGHAEARSFEILVQLLVALFVL